MFQMVQFTITTIVAVLVAVIGSGGLWSYIQHKEDQRQAAAKNESTERKALEAGVLDILGRILKPALKKCILEGQVGYEEFDELSKLFDEYSRLGGNGTVNRRYKMAKTLPRYDDHDDERTWEVNNNE